MGKEKGIPRVDALAFTCPKCGSTPGNYCMTEKGHASKVPHVKRSKLIERSYHTVLAQQPRPSFALSPSELRSLNVGDTVFTDGKEFRVRSVASTWVFLVNDPRPININQAALCSKRERIPVFKSRDDFIKSRTDKIRYACLKVAVSKLKFDSFNMTAGLRDELIATLERHKVKVLE